MNAVRWRALSWWVAALAVALACGAQLMRGGVVQTDLMALLPATEQNPVAERAVARIAELTADRVVLLAGGADFAEAAAAARTVAGALRGRAGIRQVVLEVGNTDLGQLTGFYAPHRFQLLSAADRAQLAGGGFDARERLERKLYAPLRFGLALPVAQDPFGLADDWLAALPLRNLRLVPQDQLLVAQDGTRTWVLVLAELAGSAYAHDTQRDASAALADARAALRTAYPRAELLATGALLYATEARTTAEREFHTITAGSLLGMALLLYLVFRSPRPLALGLLSVAFGIGAAFAVTVAVHGQIHLITLVFGAALLGEAVDYCIQYFAAHMGAGAAWDAQAGLRAVAPGLVLALATSLLGYGALLFTPFPALSQIALFAFVGLCAAWATVFLLLPAVVRTPSRRAPGAALAAARSWLLAWQRHVGWRASLLLALAVAAASAPGWWLLRGNDDIRLLVTRPPALAADEARIRALTGIGNGTQFFLVEGDSAEQVLQREEALTARLAALQSRGDLASWQALSGFVPSARQQAADRALWAERVFADRAALARLLDDAGLREDAVARFIADFDASAGRTLAPVDWLATPMSTAFRHLWLGATGAGQASLVLPQGADDVARLREAAAGLPGVTLVDKAGSIGALFARYRTGGAAWLAAAMVLIYGVLALRYGPRQAVAVLLPTLLAAGLTLAAFGYAGAPITLFHIMGLMLVLGVGVNYSIFLREGGMGTSSALAGVLLSAGTTMLSFGLLAFSSTPALAGFGRVLLLGVSASMLLAPLALSLAPPRKAQP